MQLANVLLYLMRFLLYVIHVRWIFGGADNMLPLLIQLIRQLVLNSWLTLGRYMGVFY
jgi:hypothetical protein